MSPRIEKVVTSGTFSLDGQDFAVDNNVWLLGDDHEVVVIDAAHDPDGFCECGLHLLKIGHVRGQGSGQTRKLLLNLVSRLGVAVEHTNRRSFFQKTAGCGCASPRSCRFARCRSQACTAPTRRRWTRR